MAVASEDGKRTELREGEALSTLDTLAMFHQIQMRQYRSASQLIARASALTKAMNERSGEFEVSLMHHQCFKVVRRDFPPEPWSTPDMPGARWLRVSTPYCVGANTYDPTNLCTGEAACVTVVRKPSIPVSGRHYWNPRMAAPLHLCLSLIDFSVGITRLGSWSVYRSHRTPWGHSASHQKRTRRLDTPHQLLHCPNFPFTVQTGGADGEVQAPCSTASNFTTGKAGRGDHRDYPRQREAYTLQSDQHGGRADSFRPYSRRDAATSPQG